MSVNVDMAIPTSSIVKSPLPFKNAGKTLRILGTRGIPANHGGFETFAEQYALFMVKQGWTVEVFCQEIGRGPIRREIWHGIHRIVIPVPWDTNLGTILFDLRSVLYACVGKATCLTLGYNTAIFCLLLRLSGQKTIMNMDGIEWSRKKWPMPARIWLYINEWIGARLNQFLIADHPEISRHLQRHTRASKIHVIPYGAEIPKITPTEIPLELLGLSARKYALVIARPEPENSIFEIVTAWSKCKRGIPLVILGNYVNTNPYHSKVLDAASIEVNFVGAIYDKSIVNSLRHFAKVYLHGHQVGGTNPSLVEAMAFSNPVIAHDNQFNRWVAGEFALYFSSTEECESRIEQVLACPEEIKAMAEGSKKRYERLFTLDAIHQAYMALVDS